MKCRIIYKAFPEPLRGSVRGMTSLQGDLYIILVDALQIDSKRKETLKHELSHILLGHFMDDERSVDALEDEAIRYAAAMTDDDLDQILQKVAT